MNSITVCNQHSVENSDREICNFIVGITKDTDPSEFDKFCQTHTDYKLADGGYMGWNALGIAAYRGNVKLIHHIMQIGQKELLNIGCGKFGWTPLYCAVNCLEKSIAPVVTLELLRWGANINIATCLGFKEYPSETTPLWAAACKTECLKTMKLLVLYGAQAADIPEISSKARQLIENAKRSIDISMSLWNLLYLGSIDKESILSKLPIELIKKVCELTTSF